jgi:hypothetical protein
MCLFKMQKARHRASHTRSTSSLLSLCVLPISQAGSFAYEFTHPLVVVVKIPIHTILTFG